MHFSIEMNSRTFGSDLANELQTRLARPQRHRLLHGFPLTAAMPKANKFVQWAASAGDPGFNITRDPGQPPFASPPQLWQLLGTAH